MPHLLRLLLILSLLSGQPAGAGHAVVHHGADGHAAVAMTSMDVHRAAQDGPRAPDCGKTDNHGSSCGACCAALSSQYIFGVSLIPSLRPELARLRLVQPDLAVAIKPPRSLSFS